MRHRKSGRALGRTASHRKALIRNQVTDLLRYGRIVTTEAKAKELRPAAERAITLGKRGDLHARRQASALMTDRRVLRHLFETLGPLYRERRGGYTRITKLGPRLGDGAEMAQIELLAEIETGDEPTAEAPAAPTTPDPAPTPAENATDTDAEKQPATEAPADEDGQADTAAAPPDDSPQDSSEEEASADASPSVPSAAGDVPDLQAAPDAPPSDDPSSDKA